MIKKDRGAGAGGQFPPPPPQTCCLNGMDMPVPPLLNIGNHSAYQHFCPPPTQKKNNVPAPLQKEEEDYDYIGHPPTFSLAGCIPHLSPSPGSTHI